VISDLGVFTLDKSGGTGLTLIELAPGVGVEEITRKTEATFKVHPSLASQAA
ncbi:MAG: succinyl-CoA--3-ketoacid-CoA transferase, partial [Methylovirgula sp.]